MAETIKPIRVTEDNSCWLCYYHWL